MQDYVANHNALSPKGLAHDFIFPFDERLYIESDNRSSLLFNNCSSTEINNADNMTEPISKPGEGRPIVFFDLTLGGKSSA